MITHLQSTQTLATGGGEEQAQAREGQDRLIAQASRSSHPVEMNDGNCGSFQLELLALKGAVTEKFKDYPTGAQSTVYTDNNPVAQPGCSGTSAGSFSLLPFNFDIKHRSGKINVNALSSFPVPPGPAEMPSADCDTGGGHNCSSHQSNHRRRA